MVVQKGNRQLTIAPEKKEAYLNQGYDVLDAQGKVVAESTANKMYTQAEHSKIVKAKDDKIDALTRQIAELQSFKKSNAKKE